MRTLRRTALAEALVAARHEAGLTQQQLADKAGLSRSAIARLETGKASIGSDLLWDLAVALGQRPSHLFAIAEENPVAEETLKPTS
ncbi:MAG: helix-turn-helix transcriptional regulator [Gordonia sp. (in: high G+C Gram-positive bacteria)]|uniref:helix-turn-helix domain-containing protein n=1 Tax=Gordonia sp. (in: high G+C Gram-positive bacteria) TaxID=84139 RepID=UPI0039E54C4E